ncbi:MAG TPA: CHAD domain-containing protein [Candidatus Elarobacter sp.]|jgi:CHAD domain-containing protein|nr:CHAD domain-containing protein [Candidatus Elarobacter sp.]
MSDVTVERELKLEPDEAFSLARLDPRWNGYVASPVKMQRLHTIYYDTPDLRLTRWGCSLRLRRGEGWTLKIPVPHETQGLAREEHVFPENGGAIPGRAVELATAYLRGAAPRPVAELRTLRVSRHVSTGDGDDVAEVVEDDVRVVEGTRVVRRFRQVEIELNDSAPGDLLDALGSVLRAEGAGDPDPVPKNVRALGDRARRPELDAPALGRDARVGDVVRAALAGSVERIVRLDATLRLNPDEEAVHHARVAVRRLRSDLRTFRCVLERAWADGLRDRLAWLQDGLSSARDADVLIATVRRRSETLPDAERRAIDTVLEPLRAARTAAYERVGAMLRDVQYVALLQSLVDGAKHPAFEAASEESARVAIPRIIARVWKTMRKRVRERTRPPSDRELHRIRIVAKRLRYAAEAAERVAGRRARRLARAAERVQTVLGEQHDAVVAYERLRAMGGVPERAFLAGEVAAHEHLAALDARAAWTGPWRAVKRARRRFARG